MGEIRKAILGLCLAFWAANGLSQQNAHEFVDSILALEVSNLEKVGKVESFLKKLPENEPFLEDAYYEFAKWSKVRNGDDSRAQFYGKKERTLRLEKYPSNDDKTKRNLYNLGYFHYYASEPDLWTAKAYYDTLVSVSENSERRTGNAYRELGNIYSDWGDFQNALDHHFRSEQVLKKAEQPWLQLITLINILGTYVDLNDPGRIDEFLAARNRIDSLEGVEIDVLRKGKILYNTAAMFQIANRLEEAEENAHKALPLFQTSGDVGNAFNSLSLLGVIAIKKGAFEKARSYFNDAQAYAKDHPILLSNISNNLGDLELSSKNHETALNHYYDALQRIIPGDPSLSRSLPSQSDISISPEKKRLFGYLSDLSKGWITYFEATGERESLIKAEEVLALADKTIDELFLESQEEVSKLTWRNRASTLYMNAIRVAYLLDKPEQALYYIEKNKGMLLLENTTDVLAKQRANIPNEALERERILLGDIKTKMLSLTEATTQNTSTQEMETIKESIFSLKNRYRKFIDSLEVEYPMYVSSKKRLTISTLEDIRADLADGEHVVSYAIGNELGYALLIAKDRLDFQEIPMAVSDLSQRINDFQKLLKQPFESTDAISEYQLRATELFEALFPFEGFSNVTDLPLLTVIPDGIIQKIPFEALTFSTEQPITQSYLIFRYPISYKYSHSLDAQIAALHKGRNSNHTSFLPVRFEKDYLEKLPYSSQEAEMMTPYFDQNIYTQEAATKEFFLDQFDKSSIVHISTHGGTDAHGPWLGFYDTKLRLEELYFLKNQKDLIVLSACKTDVGELKKGEGVFSIKRGFFRAGARSVVSTLWDVNEKASMEIMNDFYANLQSGNQKSEALQSAKLSYLKKHENTSEASPYYWSAITLTGSDGPVSLAEKTPLALWILMGVLFLGILWFVFRKWKA